MPTKVLGNKLTTKILNVYKLLAPAGSGGGTGGGHIIRDRDNGNAVLPQQPYFDISGALDLLNDIPNEATHLVIPSFDATSNSSLTIGAGSHSLSTQMNRGFKVGDSVNFVSGANQANNFTGLVTSYDRATGAMSVTELETDGSGTHSDWELNITGSPGEGYYATSGTNVTPGTGSFILTLDQPQTAWAVNSSVRVVSQSNSANFFQGAIVAYTGNQMTVGVALNYGGVAASDWVVTPATGAPGQDGDRYRTTSATPITLPLNIDDIQALTVEAGLQYMTGQPVGVTSRGNDENYFVGKVTSYNEMTGALSLRVIESGGTGTHTDWDVNLTGIPGVDGRGYYATSTTLETIGLGSKTFTTDQDADTLAWLPGASIRATSVVDPSDWMQGLVTAYSGQDLTINVTTRNGSGAANNWNFNPGAGEDGRGYYTTSSSNVLIGTGTKTFTTDQSDDSLAWVMGAKISAINASDANEYMDGVVTSYSGTTLEMDSTNPVGSGFVSNWVFASPGGSAVNLDTNQTPLQVEITNTGGDNAIITPASGVLTGSNESGVITPEEKDDIETNFPNAIAQNATDIGDNATAIANNAVGIGANSLAITDNKSDIDDNTAAIGVNAGNISTNTGLLAGVQLDGAGSQTQSLRGDGTYQDVPTGGGSTNLDYTPAPTEGTVTSDTGTDATIPATDAINAGLLLPAEKTAISTNTANIAQNVTDIGNNTAAIAQNATDIDTQGTPAGGIANAPITKIDGTDYNYRVGGAIAITSADLTTEMGRIADTATGDGIVIGFLGADGNISREKGNIQLDEEGLALLGSTVVFDKEIRGGQFEPRPAYFDPISGNILSGDPSDKKWERLSTDPTDYDLGSGAGAQPWVNLTNLVITTPEDVNSGDRVDVAINLYVENKSDIRTGVVEYDWIIEGTPANNPVILGQVTGGFKGYLGDVATLFPTFPVPSGSTVTVRARINQGSTGLYGVDLLGSVNPHQLNVSIPGEGGATIAITTVQDEGVAIPFEPTINFIGAGVSASQDIPNNRININIPGGGGGIGSGATFPVSPTVDELFLLTLVNRTGIYRYDGSTWQIQTMESGWEIYVDPLGTDNPNNGDGTGADAFATLEYALAFDAQAPTDGIIRLESSTPYTMDSVVIPTGVNVKMRGIKNILSTHTVSSFPNETTLIVSPGVSGIQKGDLVQITSGDLGGAIQATAAIESASGTTINLAAPIRMGVAVPNISLMLNPGDNLRIIRPETTINLSGSSSLVNSSIDVEDLIWNNTNTPANNIPIATSDSTFFSKGCWYTGTVGDSFILGTNTRMNIPGNHVNLTGSGDNGRFLFVDKGNLFTAGGILIEISNGSAILAFPGVIVNMYGVSIEGTPVSSNSARSLLRVLIKGSVDMGFTDFYQTRIISGNPSYHAYSIEIDSVIRSATNPNNTIVGQENVDGTSISV